MSDFSSVADFYRRTHLQLLERQAEALERIAESVCARVVSVPGGYSPDDGLALERWVQPEPVTSTPETFDGMTEEVRSRLRQKSKWLDASTPPPAPEDAAPEARGESDDRGDDRD